MSDSWKLNDLSQKVFELEQSNRKLVSAIVYMQWHLQVGDPVCVQTDDGELFGKISHISLDKAHVLLSGDKISTQFDYINVSKMGVTDGRI